jgi:hypothetical protein
MGPSSAPAVQNNISNEARSFGSDAAPRSSNRSSSEGESLETPALTYASEIKPEDLPF